MFSTVRLYLKASRGLIGLGLWVVLLKGLAGLFEAVGLVWLLQLVGEALVPGMAGQAQVAGVQRLLKAIGWNHFGTWEGIWGVTLLGFVTVILRFVGESLLCTVMGKSEESIRRRHARAVVQISWPSFLRTRLGASSDLLLARGAQAGFAVNSFIYFVSETVGASLCFATAFVVAPSMTVFIGGFFLILVLGVRRVGRGLERHFHRLPNSARLIGELSTEFLTHLKFLRSVGRGGWAISRLDSAFAGYRHATFYLHLSRSIPLAFVEATGVLFIAFTFLAGVKYRWFPLAEGVTFLALFYRIAPRLQMALAHFAQMRARAPLIADLLERDAEMTSSPAELSGSEPAVFQSEIRFSEVSFAYRKEDSPFELDDINFTIQPGRCVALVGESGAGKSTILDLLTGLLQPKSGSVRIDGMDLRRIDLRSWRERIGLVSQEIPVFEGTLLENLVWDSKVPDLAAVERCLRQAGLWEFIVTLPKGLATQVGPGGLRLSGGQRQRLALARALCGDPALLVLDEATSSLDSGTESLLQEELKRIQGTIAMLMIAHRLKTVEMADEILVFHRGQIVERGTWNDLLRRRGVFARMAAEQGIAAVPQRTALPTLPETIVYPFDPTEDITPPREPLYPQ